MQTLGQRWGMARLLGLCGISTCLIPRKSLVLCFSVLDEKLTK